MILTRTFREDDMLKNIMIVDDAKTIRQTVSFILKNEGHNVIEACDGQDALGKLKSDEKINLIISDVNMPNMDGITFIKTLKNDAAYEAYKFTPVIMLTTEYADELKEQGKAAGVRAWITKPFPPEKLVDAVKKLLV